MMIDRPTISVEEFHSRKILIQNLMGEHSIDLLFVYGDDRAVLAPITLGG
jgi:hypothetical protein